MKCAIISVTNHGAVLGNKLSDSLVALNHKVTVFAKKGRNPLQAVSYESLSALTREIFAHYEGLIFIMATGIVVRVIAPFVKDKRIDPAVVVMDEQGTFAISLLAGHIGGGNELATLIGHTMGARPVITTATDVSGKPAVDVLAVKLNRNIEPFSQLKLLNGALVNGDKVVFFIDKTLDNQEFYRERAKEVGVELRDLNCLTTTPCDAAVLITDQTMALEKLHLYVRPMELAVGIGCRRGTTAEEIMTALKDACYQIGASTQQIRIIGSTVVKQDEAGLLAVIEDLAVPSVFFNNEELQQCIDDNELEVSSFVKKQIGVGNVCAAAAILAGKRNKLLLPKTKYKNVTLAIAPVKLQSLE